MLDRVQRPDETLTPREGEVLELLGAGLTNRAIAERLYLSESTVKTHLVRVFAKLGVDGRAAAVAEATRRGVIELT
nr:response regulator transcription factor [Frigoribacterium sp. CFBP 8751]